MPASCSERSAEGGAEFPALGQRPSQITNLLPKLGHFGRDAHRAIGLMVLYACAVMVYAPNATCHCPCRRRSSPCRN